MKKFVIILGLIISTSFNGMSQCSTAVLEGFGSVSAIAIYNTYITIGSIADGYTNETYDANYVSTLMTEQSAMIDVINQSLQACVDDDSEGALDSVDKKYISDFIVALEYLRKEAEGFQEYVSNESESGLNKFSKNRDLAWKKIAELLELE